MILTVACICMCTGEDTVSSQTSSNYFLTITTKILDMEHEMLLTVSIRCDESPRNFLNPDYSFFTDLLAS